MLEKKNQDFSLKNEFPQIYEEIPIENKLNFNLRRIGNILSHNAEPRGSQFHILFLLDKLGSLSQKKLIQITQVRSASMSELIMKLESAGYIKKEEDSRDRRGIIVELTELGRSASRTYQETNDKDIKELFSCLSNEEIRQMNATLEKLRFDWTIKFSQNKE